LAATFGTTSPATSVTCATEPEIDRQRCARNLAAPPIPQRIAAKVSHGALYALMAAMPLVGWAMLSASGAPLTLLGTLHLPPIAPHAVRLHALLRALHTGLAFALIGLVLGHLAAALFHGLIRRDGVFSSMARSDQDAR